MSRLIANTAIVIALLLNAGPLASQPVEEDKGNPPPQSTPTDSGAANTEQAAKRSAPAAPAAEKSDDSPFDYQSSEEISEDLSVSFPVDI